MEMAYSGRPKATREIPSEPPEAPVPRPVSPKQVRPGTARSKLGLVAKNRVTWGGLRLSSLDSVPSTLSLPHATLRHGSCYGQTALSQEPVCHGQLWSEEQCFNYTCIRPRGKVSLSLSVSQVEKSMYMYPISLTKTLVKMS